jgi:cytochrome bd-type quinol oxidase subunit 2
LVKTERMQAEEVEPASGSAWLIGAAAWFLPGLGHVLLKRWNRAVLMGGSVLACFVLGLAMGGHMFDLSTGQGSSQLLQVPPMIANLGTGVLYIISWLAGYGFADDPAQAARATYEYGNTFLLIAGLMNFLTMLDAFDIAAGRKP